MGVGASVAFVIFACILTIALTRIIISKEYQRINMDNSLKTNYGATSKEVLFFIY